MLDRHAGSVEVTPVQVADSVVGIPVVVKLNEAESFFEQNVEPSLVPLKEVLYVC